MTINRTIVIDTATVLVYPGVRRSIWSATLGVALGTTFVEKTFLLQPNTTYSGEAVSSFFQLESSEAVALTLSKTDDAEPPVTTTISLNGLYFTMTTSFTTFTIRNNNSAAVKITLIYS